MNQYNTYSMPHLDQNSQNPYSRVGQDISDEQPTTRSSALPFLTWGFTLGLKNDPPVYGYIPRPKPLEYFAGFVKPSYPYPRDISALHKSAFKPIDCPTATVSSSSSDTSVTPDRALGESKGTQRGPTISSSDQFTIAAKTHQKHEPNTLIEKAGPELSCREPKQLNPTKSWSSQHLEEVKQKYPFAPLLFAKCSFNTIDKLGRHKRHKNENESSSFFYILDRLPSSSLASYIVNILQIFCRTYGPSAPTPANSDEPKMPLIQFVDSVIRKADLERTIFLESLVLLERCLQSSPSAYISMNNNVHRLFLVSLIVMTKFHNDMSYPNKDWDKMTGGCYGISLINTMELEFLSVIGYKVWVKADEVECLVKRISTDLKK